MATTIPAAVITLISSIPKLNDSNWFTWSKKMKMVFLAAELSGVVDGNVPTEAKEKSAWDKRDCVMVAYLFMAVEDDLQYMVEEESCASMAWAKLKGHFERSTMSMRMAARRELYDISHDPSKPIEHYLQSLGAARTKLKALGCTIDDTEFKDIMLMHLHTSLHPVRTSLLTQPTEPALATIKTILTSSAAADIAVKIEPADDVLAAREHSRKPSPIDNAGYRWCDVTNDSSCHRCGRSGHIAARCMFNMPSTVKDWIMSTRPRPPSPTPSSSPQANFSQEPGQEQVSTVQVFHSYDPNSGVGPLLI